MIRDSLHDSNTQLTSLGHISIKSCSSEILSKSERECTLPIKNRTGSHDFMVMKYNKIVLPTYHPLNYWDDQDANLKEIKFCGFGKCPNRYGYITRPDVLKDVFRKSD